MKRLWFYIKLYPYFVSRSVQARMSYKGDFILGVVASILMQSLGFVFLWTIFRGIPEVNGWNFDQMIFVYGMSAISLGLNEFLFAGTWKITGYVQGGELDRLLLRPVSTMFSILAADVTLHGLGSVLFGLAVCITSLLSLEITLSVGMVLFWIVVMVCGALIFFAANMLMATLAFWVTDSQSAMMVLQNVSEFGKYPAAIYGKWLRILVSFVIPFAFTSYYPAAYILGIEIGMIYYIGPIAVTLICLAVTVTFWRFGLAHYQSAGG